MIGIQGIDCSRGSRSNRKERRNTLQVTNIYPVQKSKRMHLVVLCGAPGSKQARKQIKAALFLVTVIVHVTKEEMCNAFQKHTVNLS